MSLLEKGIVMDLSSLIMTVKISPIPPLIKNIATLTPKRP